MKIDMTTYDDAGSNASRGTALNRPDPGDQINPLFVK